MRVVGERLERLGHAIAAARRARCAQLVDARARGPSATHVPLRKSSPPRTVSSSPSETWSKRSASGRVDQAHTAADERSGPGFGYRPVCDGATFTTTRTPESIELLGRDAVEVGVVDDRDVVGPQPLRRGSSCAGRAVRGPCTRRMPGAGSSQRSAGTPGRRAYARARPAARSSSSGSIACASGRRGPSRR